MDPITMALISAGINLGGGLLADMLGSPADAEAYRYRKEALAKLMGVSVPKLEELVAKEQGPTNLAGVTTDPRFDAYQDETQARLREVGNSGGLDAQARARQETARQQSAQYERSQREGVLASARARGTLGTGEELSALLQAQQAGADRERMADVNMLGDAEARALDAIMASGSMAAERQGRQWGQKAQVATAQDAIDRFNTATANDFTMANAQQRQQDFENRLRLAQVQAGGLQGMAGVESERADRTRQKVGGVAQAVGYGVGAYGQSPMAAGAGATSAGAVAPVQRQATAYEAANPGAIGSNAALNGYFTNRRKAR